jgi:hypothetical protein
VKTNYLRNNIGNNTTIKYKLVKTDQSYVTSKENSVLHYKSRHSKYIYETYKLKMNKLQLHNLAHIPQIENHLLYVCVCVRARACVRVCTRLVRNFVITIKQF